MSRERWDASIHTIAGEIFVGLNDVIDAWHILFEAIDAMETSNERAGILRCLRLVLSGAVLASGSGLLLERLLLWGICIANLDVVLLAIGFGDRTVAELKNNLLAYIVVGKASESNTTTRAVGVAQDALGANIDTFKDRTKIVLIELNR